MSAILLLSEQEVLSGQLSSAFLPHGISLIAITDPQEFIQKVKENAPAIIIVDVAVAGRTGLSSIEALRGEEPSIAKIPVILAEDTGDLMVISQALKFGIADYFLTSKLDIPLVVQKVFKCLPKDSVPDSAPPIVEKKVEQKYILLLIEDDRFLRDLAIKKLNSDKNFNVITAGDGEQGIILAERHIPHIILVDLSLPGIDGFETLRRLRMKQQFGRTIIVMLSNFGQREDMERAAQLGANQFFIKANYTLDEIVDEIKKLLGIN